MTQTEVKNRYESKDPMAKSRELATSSHLNSQPPTHKPSRKRLEISPSYATNQRNTAKAVGTSLIDQAAQLNGANTNYYTGVWFSPPLYPFTCK